MLKKLLSSAVVLLVVACGGGAGSGTTDKLKAGEHIFIGQIASLTGPYTALGTNDKLGAEQAVADINGAGGINGHPIDLKTEDDQTKQDQSVVDYNDLAGQGAVAVIGSSFSGSGFATVPLTTSKKMPYISTAASDEIVLEGGKAGGAVLENVFQVPAAASIVGKRILAYLQAKNETKLAVLHDTTNPFADSGLRSMSANAGGYGVSIVDEETYESKTTQFATQMTHIKASSAQAIMVWGTGAAVMALIVHAYRAAGITIPLVFSHSAASAQVVKGFGSDGEGVIIASSAAVVGPHLPAGYPDTKLINDFATKFQAKNGYYPPEFAFDAYVAVQLVAEAIRLKKSTTATDINAALNSMTLQTALGTYKFSKTNHYGVGINTVSIDVVKNGEMVPTDWATQQLQAGK